METIVYRSVNLFYTYWYYTVSFQYNHAVLQNMGGMASKSRVY